MHTRIYCEWWKPTRDSEKLKKRQATYRERGIYIGNWCTDGDSRFSWFVTIFTIFFHPIFFILYTHASSTPLQQFVQGMKRSTIIFNLCLSRHHVMLRSLFPKSLSSSLDRWITQNVTKFFFGRFSTILNDNDDDKCVLKKYIF